MSQSLARNVIHLIFSTKERQRIITDAVRSELHSYAIGILTDEGCFVIAINSVEDHVHILFELNKNVALAVVVQNIKQGTSRWLKMNGKEFADFSWQAGYGAFSVSASNVNDVASYIAHQQEHHRTKSFQEELRAFLTKHSVAFDERYLWD